MNADQNNAEIWEFAPNNGEIPAHLEFRRIAITEFAEESKPQAVGFHYRSHSSHLFRRAGAN